jgi:hypothetical protein
MNYTIIYIVLGLALAGVSTWLLILILKEKTQSKDDVIWDTRLCPVITKGYTKLAQIDTKIGKSGRLLVSAKALDVDIDRIEKEHLKLPIIIKFAIPPELVDSLSKGDASRDKHEKIAQPRNAKDIPSKIRNTRYGIAWAEAIESKNRQRAIEEIMTKDNKAQTKIADMLSHDKLLSEFERVMENIQKLNAEAVKEFKKPASSPYSEVKSHTST